MKIFELIVNPYSNRPEKFPISARGLFIGSGPTVDLRLNDAAVSRLHARIRMEEETIVIQDLDSMIGTHVNGAPVAERKLKDGDLIRIGSIEIMLRLRKMAPAK